MEGKKTIEVQYSCKWCLLQRIAVKVPAWEEKQSVKAWMDQTVLLIKTDHDARQPMCTIPDGKMKEVWIPMPPGTTKMGSVP